MDSSSGDDAQVTDLHTSSRSPPSFRLAPPQSTPRRFSSRPADDLKSPLADDESFARYRQSRALPAKRGLERNKAVMALRLGRRAEPFQDAISTSSSTLVDRDDGHDDGDLPGIMPVRCLTPVRHLTPVRRLTSPSRSSSPTPTVVQDWQEASALKARRGAPTRLQPDGAESAGRPTLLASGNAATRVRDVFARVIRSPPLVTASSRRAESPPNRPPSFIRRGNAQPSRPESAVDLCAPVPSPDHPSPALSEAEGDILKSAILRRPQTTRPPGHLSVTHNSCHFASVSLPVVEHRQIQAEPSDLITRPRQRSTGADRPTVQPADLVAELLDALPDGAGVRKPSLREAVQRHRPTRCQSGPAEDAVYETDRRLEVALDEAARTERALLSRLEDVRRTLEDARSAMEGKVSRAVHTSFASVAHQRRSWLLWALFAEFVLLLCVARISRRQGDGVYQGAYLDPFAPSSLHAQMWPAEVFGPSVLPETLLLFGLPRLHWAELVSGAQASLRTCVIGVISGGGRPALRVPT